VTRPPDWGTGARRPGALLAYVQGKLRENEARENSPERRRARDLAEREEIARAFSLDIEDVPGGPGLRDEAGTDRDLVERKRIAREYGLALEEVP
jgi:hypothetical protein